MVCKCKTKEEHANRAVSYERDAHAAKSTAADREIASLRAQLAALTPDASQYEIIEAVPIGPHLVMRVRYPVCEHRPSDRVMVFLDAAPVDALKWRRIDPHFREGPTASGAAPPPSARFPATAEGWADAQSYARAKERVR